LQEAETCFGKAVEIARRQGAKSMELRAAIGLSRLWRGQGKTRQARSLMMEAFGWFAEGHGTQDLRDAKTCLAELDSRQRRCRANG
jgi:predicted ATPase